MHLGSCRHTRFAELSGSPLSYGATLHTARVLFVVWVTGASSGIGEELAYQLVKIGARLVLSARRENELERVKKRCLEMHQFPLLTSISLCFVAFLPKIDILVNNGGRSQRSLFVDTSLDVYRAIVELNYLGTISLTKHVLDHMIQRKKGKIVTVSSVMGIMGAPLATGYCASKHALQGFFNSLRPELTDYPEISIINICPGPVQSQIIQNVFTEELSKLKNTGDQSHKMTTHRCCQLMLVSIVNDVLEAWISDHPYLAVCYLWQYAPTWAWWLLHRMGKRRIQNFKSGVVGLSQYSFLSLFQGCYLDSLSICCVTARMQKTVLSLSFFPSLFI
uniref:Dehydrogenase/reductase 7 n=1 Tax=Sphenodon punctatus TaxID=8508 RepID=A0A8D0GYD8_SPHPU